MQHNQEINTILLIQFSFRRTRLGSARAGWCSQSCLSWANLLAGGTKSLAPADASPPCHSTTWQILNFGFVQRTFKSIFTFLNKGRW